MEDDSIDIYPSRTSNVGNSQAIKSSQNEENSPLLNAGPEKEIFINNLTNNIFEHLE